MSFDFLGTFNRSQFDRLADFARRQVGDLDARIQHLTAERLRVGTVTFAFDKGNATGYRGDPVDSYIGKLLAAYEVLGGDALYDLQIRQKNTQALFLVRGDETQSARILSDGRVVGGEGLMDADSAVLVAKMREWMDDALQYKREALERKIRRALDYSDQLLDEINLLTLIKQGKESKNSLENIISQIQQLLSDRHYRAIADDKGKDPNGLMAYAPFVGLEPGPSRPSDDYGRSLDGYVTPEENDKA